MKKYKQLVINHCFAYQCAFVNAGYRYFFSTSGWRWREMRIKYFNDKLVYPDEMIIYLNQFDEVEVLTLLHYCCEYKERFYTGAFADYAIDIIGPTLLHLKSLPGKMIITDLIPQLKEQYEHYDPWYIEESSE